jgi:hypothetical protein
LEYDGTPWNTVEYPVISVLIRSRARWRVCRHVSSFRTTVEAR